VAGEAWRRAGELAHVGTAVSAVRRPGFMGRGAPAADLSDDLPTGCGAMNLRRRTGHSPVPTRAAGPLGSAYWEGGTEDLRTGDWPLAPGNCFAATFTPFDATAYRAIPLYSASAICSR